MLNIIINVIAIVSNRSSWPPKTKNIWQSCTVWWWNSIRFWNISRLCLKCKIKDFSIFKIHFSNLTFGNLFLEIHFLKLTFQNLLFEFTFWNSLFEIHFLKFTFWNSLFGIHFLKITFWNSHYNIHFTKLTFWNSFFKIHFLKLTVHSFTKFTKS